MKDKILAYLKMKGPIVPTDLSSYLGIQSMIASAYLSDLTASKQVLISRLKFGNSPLYYLPEHHEKLEEFSSHLHQREQEALAMLKREGVLREKFVDPVVRVALREIKDFAVPLEVTYRGEVEVFWKLWSLSPEESKEKIRQFLETSEIASKPAVSETSSVAEKQAQTVVQEENVQKTEGVQRINVASEVVSETEVAPIVEEKVVEKVRAAEIETREEIKKVESERPKTRSIPSKKKSSEVQQALKENEITDAYMLKIMDYFSSQEIEVIEADLVKVDAECNFVITMDTPLGISTFYCKAKDKKRISEGDITSLFAEASLRNLPGAFISSGELSKPAEKTLMDFPSLIFVQL